MRHLPNLISILRIALVWPIVLSIAHANYLLTLVLFFIAAMSDGIDGFLAKRFNWTSELGKLLDPLADKLLLVGVFLVATWYGLIPRWLTIAAVGRDLLILFGSLAFHFGWGPLNGRPLLSSKINTLLQLLYVLAIIAHAGYALPSRGVLDVLAWLTLATVLISGMAYVREFTRRALQAARA
jgi:cardiolipin synthase